MSEVVERSGLQHGLHSHDFGEAPFGLPPQPEWAKLESWDLSSSRCESDSFWLDPLSDGAQTECGTPEQDQVLNLMTGEHDDLLLHTAHPTVISEPPKESKKRPATTQDAGNPSSTSCVGHNNLKQVQRLIDMLQDKNFRPGIRPDNIMQRVVPPEGIIYKEHPKRRRVFVKPKPGEVQRLPRDKWYNTGGIKSASDRWDSGSGFGLRKRYGKIVRSGGQSVLRFQEYKLLTRADPSHDVQELKDGPTLFVLIPEARTRGDDSASQNTALKQLRTHFQQLRKQLQAAEAVIALQAKQIAGLRHQHVMNKKIKLEK